jgi:hypothetical protein
LGARIRAAVRKAACHRRGPVGATIKKPACHRRGSVGPRSKKLRVTDGGQLGRACKGRGQKLAARGELEGEFAEISASSGKIVGDIRENCRETPRKFSEICGNSAEVAGDLRPAATPSKLAEISDNSGDPCQGRGQKLAAHIRAAVGKAACHGRGPVGVTIKKPACRRRGSVGPRSKKLRVTDGGQLGRGYKGRGQKLAAHIRVAVHIRTAVKNWPRMYGPRV